MRGFMLLEVLVAILIFSIGVLGIVGLQAAMTKAQTGSQLRAEAAFLAQRLVGSMWTDRSTLANYSDASCAGYTRCSEWAGDVARVLPGGSATVNVAPLAGTDGTDPSTGNVIAANVTVTITWTPPNEETHRFTTTAAVSSKSPT
jgi:type IV pilus assembly protein PilV